MRDAATRLRKCPPHLRHDALLVAADELEASAHEVLAANRRDLEGAERDGLGATAIDRLRLTEGRLGEMADSLRDVAGLPDPVGEVVDGWVRPNGLRVERIRVPLGVVGIIYENRPNVTSDAAALCLRAGNAAFLRGSSSALESNRAVVSVLRRSLAKVGLPEDAVLLVEDTRRETVVEFMRLRGLIDCLVPRGGPSLIRTLVEQATVPYVLDGDGNCHVYVDAHADLEMATDIVVNAKTQRPGVCNAAESLLVHRDVAAVALPRSGRRARRGWSWSATIGPERSCRAWAWPTTRHFATEYLALKMSVAVVDDLDAAIAHIARYGSGHSEAIVTTDLRSAERFVQEVDAAAVVVNASTRFVDGGELGLGRRGRDLHTEAPRAAARWASGSSRASNGWCEGTGR